MVLKPIYEQTHHRVFEMRLRPSKVATQPQQTKTVQPYRVDKKPKLFLVKPGVLAEQAMRDARARELTRPAASPACSRSRSNLFVIAKPKRTSADMYQWMVTIAWLAPVAWIGHGVCHWLKLI